jgi:hypothetical protein
MISLILIYIEKNVRPDLSIHFEFPENGRRDPSEEDQMDRALGDDRRIEKCSQLAWLASITHMAL